VERQDFEPNHNQGSSVPPAFPAARGVHLKRQTVNAEGPLLVRRLNSRIPKINVAVAPAHLQVC